MRSLRQGAAVRQQRLAREQPHAPPLRPQPSVHTRPAPAGRDRQDEGLHLLHQGGQGREGGLATRDEGGGMRDEQSTPLRFFHPSSFIPPASAITSISTRASRGRRAAWTVERAGGFSPKNSA